LKVNSRAYGGESVWKQKAVEKMKYIPLAESTLSERIKPDIKKRSERTGIFTVRFQLQIWLIHETQFTL
jgi:hypothetical protein